MEMFAALGLGAKELFSYNRENFKFDQDQRLERETLRLEMQVKRFELFREDVRDLVELTVDRMDVYHLVGALFLEFCIVLFCEGRVQASAPPFLLSLFLLSNACAFIYLLLAVWLSMHASIAAHSFGVRLLTRFVRLPIPSLRQMESLKTHLRDYEKQGVANLLRLPFQDQQDWQQQRGLPAGAQQIAPSKSELPRARPRPPEESQVEPPVPEKYLVSAGGENRSFPEENPKPRSYAPHPVRIGRSQASSSTTLPQIADNQPRPSAGNLLPEEAEHPLGGEDLLTGLHGARPERHVQLFRQLQSKWQCYDAYCRVCMGLGVNQILQGLSYYCICHTLVENRSPTTGYALVVLFQATTVALAVLDLAGLKRREIMIIQVIGIMPCAITAWGIAHGARDEHGVMDPEQVYLMSPFSFLLQVLWLELWLRIAAPSGDDTAKLPRRFRQILFLDVFGDAVNWDPSQAENEAGANDGEVMDRNLVDEIMRDEERDKEAEDEMIGLKAAAEQANSQLAMAQYAVRRWSSCQGWCLSDAQQQTLDGCQELLKTWGNAMHAELVRHSHHGATDSVFEPELRTWNELDEEQQAADPFAKCLIGPFESNEGYETTIFHYDLETSRTLYGEAVTTERPGALVLTLQAVSSILEDLEQGARSLLEARIMRDLHASSRQQQALVRERQRGETNRITRLREAASAFGGGEQASSRPAIAAPTVAEKILKTIPNLLSILKVGRKKDSDRTQFLPASQDSRGADFSQPRDPRTTPDPTLVAMAGKNARHFVPERLPWQVLSRMTRVLQACWFMSGFFALLKELHWYQVDFQQHMGHDRRLHCAFSDGDPSGACAPSLPSLEFLEVPARWPQGPFLRPRGVFCPQVPNGSIWLGSPFVLYSSSIDAATSEEVNFTHLSSMLMPPGTTTACLPSGNEFNSSSSFIRCLFAAPSENGVSVWKSGKEPVFLPLESTPWSLVSGSIWRCRDADGLLPGTDVTGGPDGHNVPSDPVEWCLVLAGWDGELLPVAVVPLVDGPSEPPRRGSVVRPAVDIPLPPTDVQKGGPTALHIEARTGRLWVMLPSKAIHLWELSSSRLLGQFAMRCRVDSPMALCVDTSDPMALCVDASGAVLFVLARSGSASGPRLLRTLISGNPGDLDSSIQSAVQDQGTEPMVFGG